MTSTVDRVVSALAADPDYLRWRLSLAAHEAGHAVVAAVFGTQIASVRVWQGGPPIVSEHGREALGVCEYASADPVAEAHRPLIAAAGAVAEAVALYGPQPSPVQIGALLDGTEDGDELRQAAMTAAAGAPSPTVEVLPLVRRCWPAIAALAAQMDSGKVVSHRHVVAALGLSNNYQLHPFELANIRAGLRAVPDPSALTSRAPRV